MIIKPTMTDLLKKVHGKYSLVIATAKRARQISMGSPRLTDKKAESVVTAAAQEISEGKVVVEEEK